MSVVGRLYRGDIDIDFVGARRRWYLASGVLLLICLLSFAVRGFNWGIEFQGGTQFQFPARTVSSLVAADDAVSSAGKIVESHQYVGAGSTRQVLLKTPQMTPQDELKVQQAIASQFGLKATDVSISSVSSSWGHEVTKKALIGLVVFLVAVCIFIAVLFEPKMAVAAIVALVHDLVLAAGVYSVIGFEVTPATVVGLLTILGFSLYDTVVVFDKIKENTRGILGGSRYTYSEAANLAVNQTLMRSINTSLIALLPVAGLLFVGAGLLGVGTLKDLALVLFVGLAAGAYSSIFIATPVVADLKEREQPYIALRKRVLAKRASAAKLKVGTATGSAAGRVSQDAIPVEAGAEAGAASEEQVPMTAEPVAMVASSTPRPGARPQGRRPQQKKKGGRPQAKRRR